ncbi:MAG: hypothetical protein H6740_23730 [Alphaproteobacteria bacterium]|nr:hypothetical protein [Alphaproteobacteria bacterium]
MVFRFADEQRIFVMHVRRGVAELRGRSEAQGEGLEPDLELRTAAKTWRRVRSGHVGATEAMRAGELEVSGGVGSSSSCSGGLSDELCGPEGPARGTVPPHTGGHPMTRILAAALVCLALTACATHGPSDDCLALLDCTAAVDPGNQDLYEGTYGDGAACWREVSDALACTQACQAEHEQLAVQDPTEPACWLGDAPEARWLFAAQPVWSMGSTVGDCYDATASFSATTAGPGFALSVVYINGFTTPVQCAIDGNLAFICTDFTSDSGRVYTYTGAFNTSFTQLTLQSVTNGTADCTMEGGPGIAG